MVVHLLPGEAPGNEPHLSVRVQREEHFELLLALHDEVCDRFGLWLGECLGAGVGLGAGAGRGALLAPVEVPVAVRVDAHLGAERAEQKVGPQRASTPTTLVVLIVVVRVLQRRRLGARFSPQPVARVRVLVAVGVQHWLDVPVERVDDQAVHFGVLDQLLHYVGCHCRRDPLASVRSCNFLLTLV